MCYWCGLVGRGSGLIFMLTNRRRVEGADGVRGVVGADAVLIPVRIKSLTRPRLVNRQLDRQTDSWTDRQLDRQFINKLINSL